jgi:hypothetical protein
VLLQTYSNLKILERKIAAEQQEISRISETQPQVLSYKEVSLMLQAKVTKDRRLPQTTKIEVFGEEENEEPGGLLLFTGCQLRHNTIAKLTRNTPSFLRLGDDNRNYEDNGRALK